MINAWEIEHECYRKGYQSICGVDEAGAGPLAGRVYAAAVVLPKDIQIEGLNDSKKLSEKRREKIFGIIVSSALAYAISWADANEVDNINILNARMLAMERATQALEDATDFALIDGNKNTGISIPNQTVVKGDAKSASIAAASILAKVSRDRYMMHMAQKYPQYAFEKHKGYPTKLHYERLREHGSCEIHRKSF